MHYRVSDAKVAWRVVEGEGVLLHAETSAYFGLNRTGTLIWERLARGPLSPAEAVAWVERNSSGASGRIGEEVAAFLEELRGLDLVENAESNGSAALGGASVDSGLAPASAVAEYEPPLVLPFGELEKLILSGE